MNTIDDHGDGHGHRATTEHQHPLSAGEPEEAFSKQAEQHHVGKEHTQKSESKHINLRTRIKRLMRRTICFSKTEQMHDLVIGLFINRYEFGQAL